MEGRLRFLFQLARSREKRSVAASAVGAGQQGVTGSAAGRSVDIMVLEDATFLREGINVRRVNVVFTETFEFRSEVIDADEENIGTSGRLSKEGKAKKEDSREWNHVHTLILGLCGKPRFFVRSGIQGITLRKKSIVQ